ncbi:MAG TPA: hypothetical protein PLM79_02005 [Syntrophobacteraceae bacterium]|nr:hypothetical protein [Syntrophobacteraceae bacterium]
MTQSSQTVQENVLLTLQNSRKPEQVVSVTMDPTRKRLQTRGLKDLFGVDEIRFETRDLVENLQEIAQVISFLFETISRAEDLHLPYGYQDEFEFQGIRYTLYKEEGVRVLRHKER